MTSASKLIQASAGNAAGAGLAVEDVFSTYLYTGNGSSQTITNGIDLDGEGGLVWIKNRGLNQNHLLVDTERSQAYLSSNTTTGNTSNTGYTLNSDGFSLSTLGNSNTYDFASWTFRKAPKFFDVVTWTGNGSADRQISHNLGTTVGSVFIKNTSSSADWSVYHRSTDEHNGLYAKSLLLNSTGGALAYAAFGAHSEMTDSYITLGDGSNITWYNDNGATYVAYLFAHNDGDGEFGESGDQDIIKCGSYTGNGSTTGPTVDLGFEPQWLLVKNASASANWTLLDVMRGLPVSGSNQHTLLADSTAAELVNTSYQIQPLSDGFQPTSTNGLVNASGNTYIYIAIRRGPMKTPESGTEVFAIDTLGSTGDGEEPGYRSPFPVDMGLKTALTGNQRQISTRLLQGTELLVESTAAEAASASKQFDYMNGTDTSTATSSVNMMWMFRRAPGFFDVVAYTHDGTSDSIPHNLGVTPELKILKNRLALGGWQVGGSVLGNSLECSMQLNANSASFCTAGTFDAADTSTTFGVDVSSGSKGGNSGTFVVYLFASLPGVSKVFAVTKSSGSDATVDCGFSAGARFVMLKRTDSTGDWYVWDTERGIVAGDDPYLLLNSTAAEVTNTDYIDPDSSGFVIVDNGLADGDYIGLAIA